MASALRITRKIDYALRALICLAEMPRGELSNFETIAAYYDMPKDFLAKILRELVRGGLVESVRGAKGGYRLARSPSDITFLDVVECIEGPIALNECLGSGEACSVQAQCSMVDVWQRAQDAMLDVLRSTSLSDVSTFDCAINQVPTLRGAESEVNAQA